MSMTSKAPERNEDGGFTLPEVVIVIAIMSVILVALTGVLISYFRTTVDAESRMTESNDVQFAAAYWQRDVASIGVRSAYNTATKTFPLAQSVNVSPGCTLPTGTTLVTLAWTEYTSDVSTNVGEIVTVSYVATGASAPYELVRVRCTGTTVDSKVEVAHNLSMVQVATCDVACSGTGNNVPTVVNLPLSILDQEGNRTVAYTATLSGERRQS
ncbi:MULTISPECIES: type II secretion system protein J [unclassified Nocardioides]|uniref:PulJ/GspJ family protein n=1 Tax=unclassified Nocardioides TaxID=2615069 RepID=UPI00070379EB|nr:MULTISPECIES: type II secretion system protein [unclassified Nocardioides]KRC56960.1 hypothetical protein ASE19_03925 [Nocardioides sp. Root79]KRC77169.1 hypothetical protein ASE20_02790 [Nocardioides sp. Root240]